MYIGHIAELTTQALTYFKICKFDFKFWSNLSLCVIRYTRSKVSKHDRYFKNNFTEQ